MIALHSISKNYQTGKETVPALKNISIAFRDCEFVSILGPSGCGKTTMLNIIGGLDHASSGDLIIDGKSTKEFKDRDWDAYRNHRIGFVFQNYNLIPHLTIQQNVELALTVSGIARSKRSEMALHALGEVGLADKASHLPNELSGGQMQRVAIARALVNNPEIILADEPTGALDTNTGEAIMKLLKQVADTRLVVMVTHNPQLAEEYSTRIVSLRDGEIISDTDPLSLSEKMKVTWQRVANTSMSFFTATSLSLKNLWTKKARTFLTSFAGSIGIIGIALILALSNGVNAYITKVQNDTMSSYPLMIQSQSADIDSMMQSMIGARQEQMQNADTGDIVKENKMLRSMFGRIGVNNLGPFKEYMESHQDEVDSMTAAVSYKYDVSPLVYQFKDNSYVQLSPRNSVASSMGINTSSSFQEFVNNPEILSNQYTLVAGKYPEKYDEAILILDGNQTISDYTEYAIGLRDQAEYDRMLEQLLRNQDVSFPDDERQYTYDELLSLRYTVLPATAKYRYNAEYDIYEDMSDNRDYVLHVLADQGIELKVVGILSLKSMDTMSNLTPGIGYTSSLTQYLAKEASQTDIVKSQLADAETDVLSGRKFADEKINTGTNDTLDLTKIISVDSDAMANAIGFDIDENTISNIAMGSVQSAMNAISTDTTPIENDFNALLKDLLSSYLKSQTDADSGRSSHSLEELLTGFSAYVQEPEQVAKVNAIAGKYGISSDTLAPSFLQGMSEAIEQLKAVSLSKEEIDQYVDQIPNDDLKSQVRDLMKPYEQEDGSIGILNIPLPLREELISPSVDLIMRQEEIEKPVRMISQQLLQGKVQMQVALSMQDMAQNIASAFGNALHVDANAIENAIHLNYSQEELLRLLNTYTSNSRREYSQAENLSAFGYYDEDTPSSIEIYFSDFSMKDAFQSFIKEYNRSMEDAGKEDNVITYTDVAATLISSVKQIVDTVSYVLIAFVSISLVVSSIMIGIITYISVLERIKEIGLLRAIGASKRDIAHVFNAETFLIGLLSGLIGVLFTSLLCLPVQTWLRKISMIPDIRVFITFEEAAVLVGISVLLTFIAGLIPSNIAAKKDPILALRSE